MWLGWQGTVRKPHFHVWGLPFNNASGATSKRPPPPHRLVLGGVHTDFVALAVHFLAVAPVCAVGKDKHRGGHRAAVGAFAAGQRAHAAGRARLDGIIVLHGGSKACSGGGRTGCGGTLWAGKLGWVGRMGAACRPLHRRTYSPSATRTEESPHATGRLGCWWMRHALQGGTWGGTVTVHWGAAARQPIAVHFASNLLICMAHGNKRLSKARRACAPAPHSPGLPHRLLARSTPGQPLSASSLQAT